MDFHNLKRKIAHILHSRIHVFVFHQVSDFYDEQFMWPCDWNETESFKQKIMKLNEKYIFISLADAYKHISKDFYRRKNYAVLTADDGFVTLRNIMPWLAEMRIPITLFLNPAYLVGEEEPEKGLKSLLSIAELEMLIRECSPYVTIASHGWVHKFCTSMTNEEFKSGVNRSVDFFSKRKEYVPFYAYPCGKHTEWHDAYLLEHDLVPVYCDGMVNYDDKLRIHRECIDEGYKSC